MRIAYQALQRKTLRSTLTMLWVIIGNMPFRVIGVESRERLGEIAKVQ